MPSKISDRNRLYIGDRLYSPAPSAMEAIERLRDLGEDDKADRLTSALKEFKDRCRAIAQEL